MDASSTTDHLASEEFSAACSELAGKLVAIMNGAPIDVAMTVLEEALAYLIAIDGGEDKAAKRLMATYRNLSMSVLEELKLLRSRTLQ